MESWIVSIISSFSTVFLISAVGYLSRTWIAKRLQYSIKHEYDTKLSDSEHNRDVRLKAELISDLLSEWLSKDVDYQKLNELTFKAFLWLPTELADDLSSTLSHKNDAPDVRSLLDQVRKHLLGKDDNLEAYKIIIFTDPDKK